MKEEEEEEEEEERHYAPMSTSKSPTAKMSTK
jgi:hypothetical protein